MRNLRLPVAVAALVSLSFTPLFAGQHGNSGNHGPSTPPVHPNKPPTAGPKSTGAANDNGSKSHGPHASAPTPTNGPINFASTPLGVKLTQNTALQSRLTTNLTALGYQGTVFQAAYGFKNLGQFVAATDGTVSMVDPAKVTNAAPTKSLGQSIQTLKPTANASTTANTANKEAETEIEQTSKDSKKKS